MASLRNTNPLHTDSCVRLACKVLHKELEKGSNFVSSPLSIHIMVSLIAAGSEGKTLEQLLSFLGSQSKEELNSLSSLIVSCLKNMDGTESDGGPILSFANGVWVEKTCGLKTSFEEILKYGYRSQIEAVDFIHKAEEIVQEVNSWVENATNGLIREILQPNSFNIKTTLVLANALYFKGVWDQKFDSTETGTRSFNLLNGERVEVPFMFSDTCEKYYYKSCREYKILSILYQNGGSNCPFKFSMNFFLPHEKHGLPRLTRTLNSNPRLLNQSFESSNERVDVIWIPKFKFSFNFNAVEDMKELGLTLPFIPGGITEMSDRSLCVSKIVHKAFVEINEEGTEASAATVFGLYDAMNCSPPPILRKFIADHPFIFMIREETSKAVFFIGAVLNPLLDS